MRDIVLQDKTQLLAQPTDISEAQYFVQLGVFKKRLSANIVAHSIQALDFPLQLYQNLNHENYYLVAGPYKTKQEAQSVINQAYSQPVLFGSFMIDARKYDSINWHRIDSNFELPIKAQAITRQKTAHYYCQYALYAKRSSVNVPLVESNKNIFLSEISKQGKSYTVVLSGPFESIGEAECDTKISSALNEKSVPIIKHYKELNKITDLFD
ncbi:SPOR domain-containing protein [Pseudoalteromonas phenolica]|uniref:SPOR domain-containing protein n=1 Tax=Pseudoalteromonas phenolica TaxID=161398 RepID=UPI00137578AC|nr:SPOR domain-containing protein [Pseudoalteromonas phenolica]